MKFVRHKYSIEKFYGNLDKVIEQNKVTPRRIVMFGSGVPSVMAIYYLKINGAPIEAVIDNSKSKQGTEFENLRIYSPEELLGKYDDTFLILIASSYEDEMIEQIESMGYQASKHCVQLLLFKQAVEDYSFSSYNKSSQMSREMVREHQLRVLKRLKDICDEHHLRYWLCGGTLLGAIRHKGYIPWDDDIDILVEMKDLKTLAKILEDDPEFALASYVNLEDDFFDSCSYMYERNTLMDINYFPMQISCGVNIDLFPLVGLPEGEKFKEYMTQITELERNSWRNMYDKKKLRIATTELLNFMSSYDYDKYENCGYVLSRHREDEYLPATYYNEIVEVEFEGEYYRAPKEWHKYLIAMFGENYMELPPEKERVPHHNFRAYKE